MKKTRFEWGGASFSSHEDLLEILRQGYFKEGHAWGAVRQGWATVMSSDEVFSLLQRSSAGRGEIVLIPSTSVSIPERLRTKAAGCGPSRIYRSTSAQGFSSASAEMWSACESAAIGGASKTAPVKKKPRPTRL